MIDMTIWERRGEEAARDDLRAGAIEQSVEAALDMRFAAGLVALNAKERKAAGRALARGYNATVADAERPGRGGGS